MKKCMKTITVMALLVGAISGYSQGQIEFTMYYSGGLAQQIFNTQPTTNNNTMVAYGGYSVWEEQGSSSASRACT